VKLNIDPNDIAPPAANYVHAVKTTNASELLHTSGVLPIAPDGTVAPGLADQARCVWNNIEAIVDEASMSMQDIVSVTTYVVVGEALEPIMAARDAALAGHMAASTLVTVPALARPDWKVEVAIVASR